jgi:hypothetical protein
LSIQSLSVCVPAPCLNNCAFCVSKMHDQDYPDMLGNNRRFYHLYLNDFQRRLIYVREQGCDTVVLTGTGEPLLNWTFLKDFGIINKTFDGFKRIELQTSGVKLEDWYLRFLREHVNVSTISLSLSNMFSSKRNAEINRTPVGLEVDIPGLCAEIRKYDFNLRLSLNMTSDYDPYGPKEIFSRAKELGANQITFRILYTTRAGDTEQDEWIKNNSSSPEMIWKIKTYIETLGRELEILSFGKTKYSVNGISVVLDDDCMNIAAKKDLKYMILRPNCKLYTKWDDPGSLVF